MKAFSLLSSVILAASISSASVIDKSYSPSSQVLFGVKGAVSASTIVENKSLALVPVGKLGVRTKTILNVKVYVGQLFVSDANLFTLPSANPLESVSQPALKVVATQMTFLHDATSDQLKSAFADGFARNDVVTAVDSDIAKFLNAVVEAGPITSGDGTQTLTIVGRRLADGTEEVVVENSVGKTVIVRGTSQRFIRDVFSSWLGNVDSGLTGLKKAFTGAL